MMWTTFTIQDLRTCPIVERFRMPKDNLVQDVYDEWAASQGVPEERVTLWLDTDVLQRNARIGESNIYDGAVIYGQVAK